MYKELTKSLFKQDNTKSNQITGVINKLRKIRSQSILENKTYLDYTNDTKTNDDSNNKSNDVKMK